MAEDGETKPPKHLVNIRLEAETYERLRAWAFLEGEYSSVGAFMGGIIERAIDAAAEEIPEIDELAKLAKDESSIHGE